jgi:hypothetical protein
MDVEGRRGRRALTFGRALASDRFYGARAFQLLIVNFHMKIQEPLHSYFVGNLEWSHSILPHSSTKEGYCSILYANLCNTSRCYG